MQLTLTTLESILTAKLLHMMVNRASSFNSDPVSTDPVLFSRSSFSFSSSRNSERKSSRQLTQGFYWLNFLLVSEPRVSKHWRKLKALTITSGLPGLSFPYPPSDSGTGTHHIQVTVCETSVSSNIIHILKCCSDSRKSAHVRTILSASETDLVLLSCSVRLFTCPFKSCRRLSDRFCFYSELQ